MILLIRFYLFMPLLESQSTPLYNCTAVQLQGQWRSISTELSPDSYKRLPLHSLQRSGGCNTNTEENKVSCSWQHFSRTCLNRWRERYHRSHNLQQNLADMRMANLLDPVLGHHNSQGRQPAAVPELPNDQPHQPPKQSHAEDHTEQNEAASREDHRWRTGRLQSRKEHHREDLQAKNPLWEISPASARPLTCFYRLKKGLRRGLGFSFVGNHKDVQHQCQPYQSHEKPLW